MPSRLFCADSAAFLLMLASVFLGMGEGWHGTKMSLLGALRAMQGTGGSGRESAGCIPWHEAGVQLSRPSRTCVWHAGAGIILDQSCLV